MSILNPNTLKEIERIESKSGTYTWSKLLDTDIEVIEFKLKDG
jgi:hypothetical protein